jgi:hypothetical protein
VGEVAGAIGEEQVLTAGLDEPLDAGPDRVGRLADLVALAHDSGGQLEDRF